MLLRPRPESCVSCHAPDDGYCSLHGANTTTLAGLGSAFNSQLEPPLALAFNKW